MTYNLFSRNGILYLRLISNRKKKDLSLKLKVSSNDLSEILNKSSKPTKLIALRRFINDLNSRLETYSITLMEEGKWDAEINTIMEEVKSKVLMIKTAPVDNHTNFVKLFIKYGETRGTESTRKGYLATLNTIRQYDSKIDSMSLEDIKEYWIKEYLNFLANKGVNKNTQYLYLTRIKAVFNQAVENELINRYPFKKFRLKPQPTKKRSLPTEVLQNIFSMPIQQKHKIYLDCFKIMFMLIGINIKDLCLLKEITNNRIEYQRAKTGRPYSIKVEPETLNLIEKYRGRKFLLNYLEQSTSKSFPLSLNKRLDMIGEMFGISGMTSYWARHSWATTAFALDIPKDIIAKALGHGAITVTDIYIDYDEKKIDDANRRVLDYILYNKYRPWGTP